MSKIIELEEKTSEYYLNIPIRLRDHIDDLTDVEAKLETYDISKAILMRMRAYYRYQDKLKDLLCKRQKSSGSDFFADTVLFYLKFFLRYSAPHLTVLSEQSIFNNSFRPDISIWNGNEVVAIIECKTQLGWSRRDWESDFVNREIRIRELFPNAKAYLLVMTSINWNGFVNDTHVGNKYFTLSNKWPSVIEDDYLESLINPIETLFNKIINYEY